jgi:hypothetical protein
MRLPQKDGEAVQVMLGKWPDDAPNGQMSRSRPLGQSASHETGDGAEEWCMFALRRPES